MARFNWRQERSGLVKKVAFFGAAELVELKGCHCLGTAAALEPFPKATTTVPIVMADSRDNLAAGGTYA